MRKWLYEHDGRQFVVYAQTRMRAAQRLADGLKVVVRINQIQKVEGDLPATVFDGRAAPGA